MDIVSHTASICAALTVIAVICALVFDYSRSKGGSTRGFAITKSLASAGFILAALTSQILKTRFGTIVFCGMAMCFLGDVLLIARSKKVFLAGLGSFLAAHVALALAYFQNGVSLPWSAAGMALMLLVGPLVLSRLWSHLSKGMKRALIAYTIGISAMVMGALGALGAGINPLVSLGGFLLMASDIPIARDRFIKREFLNQVIILPLYYCGQLLLALYSGTP